MTSMMEMQYVIGDYVARNSPIELPRQADVALELGRLAGFAIGSEPEIKHVIGEAVYLLEDEGRIETTEKDDSRLVRYTAPHEIDTPPSVGFTRANLFGESDVLWDEAADLNRQLLDEPDPATSVTRKELNAIYDQLGEIFNRE